MAHRIGRIPASHCCASLASTWLLHPSCSSHTMLCNTMSTAKCCHTHALPVTAGSRNSGGPWCYGPLSCHLRRRGSSVAQNAIGLAVGLAAIPHDERHMRGRDCSSLAVPTCCVCSQRSAQGHSTVQSLHCLCCLIAFASSMSQATAAQLAAWSKGLYSRQPAEQLATCERLEQAQAGNAEASCSSRLDALAMHVFRDQCDSLGQRLLQLATVGAASTAQQLAVAKAAWQLVQGALTCIETQSYTAVQVLASQHLQTALAASLEARLEDDSMSSVYTAAMSVAVLVAVHTKQQRPGWLASFLEPATRALEVAPVQSSHGILSHALLLLWHHAQHAALLPLLPRVTDAILGKQLYLHPNSSSAMLVLSVAWELGGKAVQQRIRGVDLAAVAVMAPAALPGSVLEMSYVRAAMTMAEHPSFADDHMLHWVLPRLLKTMRRPVAQTAQFVELLPKLFASRPELQQPFLDRGLLPALACYIMACSTDLHDGGKSATVAARVLADLATQQPDTLQAAAFAHKMLNSAVQYSFGRSCQELLQMLARCSDTPDQAASVLTAQACADQLRSTDAAAAATGKAQVAQLQKLRSCALATCGRVEDKPGRLKACSACKGQASLAKPLDASGNSTGSNGGSSSTPASDDCYYCNAQCQLADRYAGHAKCLLSSLGQPRLSLELNPYASAAPDAVASRQRKYALKLIGDPNNAALKDTLEFVSALFQGCLAATKQAGYSVTVQCRQLAMDWIDAGLGRQLAACMAALEQRRAWRASKGDCQCCAAARLLQAMDIVNLALYLLLPTDSPALEDGGQARLLQQQLCSGGAVWLAFALREIGREETADTDRLGLVRCVAEVGTTMVWLGWLRWADSTAPPGATAEQRHAAAFAAAEPDGKKKVFVVTAVLRRDAAVQQDAARPWDQAHELPQARGAAQANGSARRQQAHRSATEPVQGQQGAPDVNAPPPLRLAAVMAAAATPVVLSAIAESALHYEQHTARNPGDYVDCFDLLQLLVRPGQMQPTQTQHLASSRAFVEAVVAVLENALRWPQLPRRAYHAMEVLCMLAWQDQASAEALGAGAARLVPPLLNLALSNGRPSVMSPPNYKLPPMAMETLHVLTRAPAMVEAIAASGQLRQLTAQRIRNDADATQELLAVGLLAAVHPDLVAPGSQLMAQLTRPGRPLREMMALRPRWTGAGVLKAMWGDMSDSSKKSRCLLVGTAEGDDELVAVVFGTTPSSVGAVI